MAITVETYGVHYAWLRDMPDTLRDELFAAHVLQNRLIELQEAFEDQKRAIWSSFPQVAVVEAQLASAEGEVAEAAEALKLERSKRRSKTVSVAATARLQAARSAAKEARAARRAAIQDAHETARQPLADAAERLKTARQDLYRECCTDGGMYWATFNDVSQRHDTAVKRVAKDRAAGRPARLRYRRWDGSGTIAVQLQRGAGMPARTPAMIADGDGGRWRNVLHVPGWVEPDVWDRMTRAEQRRAGRVTIRMRCGKGHIEVPVQAHRMLPPDADIVMARLSVKRVGTALRGTVTVTARVPDPAPVNAGPTVALHLGWHDGGDSAVVVATWRSSAPLDVPTDLAAVMTHGPDRCSGTIRVPDHVVDRIVRHAVDDAARDAAFNEARAELAAWLDAHGPTPHPTRDDITLTRQAVEKWRAHGRLALIALAWRDFPPTGGADLAAALESWRVYDKRVGDAAAFGRRKACRRRGDLYAQIAAVIAGQAGVLVVDDTDIASIARLESPDLPAEVETRIARRRGAVAPGGLRARCIASAERDGVPVVRVEAAGLSRIHAACSHDNGPGDMSRRVVCGGCGRTYDTEVNAVALMLARAS